MAVYLGKGMREAHGCYRSLIVKGKMCHTPLGCIGGVLISLGREPVCGNTTVTHGQCDAGYGYLPSLRWYILLGDSRLPRILIL